MTSVLPLREFLASRGITQEGAGVLGGVDGSTISNIVNGKVRARPTTVVKLARALGVGAGRMQRMCDAHYAARHPEEALSR